MKEVAHEAGELLAVGDADQDMQVIRQEDESRELDFVAPFGTSQGSDDDFVEQRAGPEQEQALHRAAGDVEECPSFGSMAESAGHGEPRAGSRTLPDRPKGGKLLRRGHFCEYALVPTLCGRVKRFGVVGGTGGTSHEAARL